MAYLKKEQYDCRRESAAKRNAENEKIAVENGMTEEQASLISDLCSLRHELHTNMDAVAMSDENLRVKQRLVKLNSRIRETGLEPMSFIPAYNEGYIDIDSICELDTYDDVEVPEPGTQEYQDWYDDEYARIYEELSNLNDRIEKYLGDIDAKFGTSFRPTGALRIF